MEIYDVIETAGHSYIVMEYVYGVTLKKYLESGLGSAKLSEDKCKLIMRQVLRGLKYLHRRSLCHRDIKLDNVMYNDAT